MTILSKAEDGLAKLNTLALKNGNSSANQKALAAAKEDLRSIAAEAKPTPPPVEPPALPIFSADSLSKVELQEKASGRITMGANGIRFEARTGDALSKTEETEKPPVTRAEVYIDPTKYPLTVTPGVPRFYRGVMTFPSNFDVKSVGFRTLLQIKHVGDANPEPAAIYMVEGPNLHWNEIGGPVIGQVVPGGSFEYLIEALWSEDPSKALQRVYVGGRQVAETHALISSTGLYIKFGYYKQASIPTGSYEHSLVIGASKAAVGM
jgi:hypothetical protein